MGAIVTKSCLVILVDPGWRVGYPSFGSSVLGCTKADFLQLLQQLQSVANFANFAGQAARAARKRRATAGPQARRGGGERGVAEGRRPRGSCKFLAFLGQILARFRLYRHRSLQVNTRFSALF